jgi:tRNA-Thr(GGU) m(6)t(6)A37 methyltransferase TsaA
MAKESKNKKSGEGVVEMRVIAHAHTDFPTKFGIPRQSGRTEGLVCRIVFVPKYRSPDALRGIEGFSHLWLLWHFSESRVSEEFRPTVRPPRLGGNRAEGVFATRSPFRPSPIGLSSVRLLGVEHTAAEGAVLLVEGADLLDGTPILDIKPFLPFTDNHPDAVGGFAEPLSRYALEVECAPELLQKLPEEKRQALLGILADDPRPAYQNDPRRVYGFPFAGFEVRFTVEGKRLTVKEICALSQGARGE